MRAISRRLSSSGNGVMLPVPARSPASTCTTGMPRWNDASAAPNAELVSPWTRTAAGKRPVAHVLGVASPGATSWNHWRKKSSKRSITEATRSFRRARCVADPERHVRPDAGELEDLAHHQVVLAGRDDDRPEALAARQREDDRDELDRLRPRAHDDEDADLGRGGDGLQGEGGRRHVILPSTPSRPVRSPNRVKGSRCPCHDRAPRCEEHDERVRTQSPPQRALVRRASAGPAAKRAGG